MFQRVARPLMTFIEGFVYAVTPRMALLIVLGVLGINLVGKYLMMAVWIQLWLPALAVVNLFINLVAINGMEALQATQGIDPTSFAGIDSLQRVCADWLATGGWLAASTPMLTLFLVYGGAITATALAGRLPGGDFVSEQTLSPSVLETPPQLQLQPQYTHDPVQGAVLTGAAGTLIPQLNWSQEAASAVSGNYRELQQASTQYSTALTSALSQHYSQGFSASDAQALNRSLAVSQSRADQYSYSLAREALSATGIQNLTASELSLAIRMGASGGFAGISSALGAVSGQTITQQQAFDLAQKVLEQAGGQNQLQAQLNDTQMADLRSGQQSEFTKQLSEADQRDLAKLQADVVQKSTEYSRAESLSQRVSGGYNASTAAVATQLLQTPGLLNRLSEELQTAGLFGRAWELAQTSRYQQTFGADPDHTRAFAAAGLGLLLGYEQADQPLDAQMAAEARAAGQDLLTAASGGTPGPASTPDAFRPATAGALTLGRVEQTVKPALHDPTVAAGTRHVVAGKLSEREQAAADWRPQILAQDRRNLEAVNREQSRAEADMRDKALAQDRQQLNQFSTDERWSRWLHDTAVSGFTKWLQAAKDHLNPGVFIGASAAAGVTAFDQARREGASFWDALGRALGHATNGKDMVLEQFYQDQVATARQQGLTPTQAQHYGRVALDTLTGGKSVTLPSLPDQAATRQAVAAELRQDPATADVVKLVEWSAKTGSHDYAWAIKQFNQHLGLLPTPPGQPGRTDKLPTPDFKGAAEYRPLVETYAKAQNLDPALIYGMIQAESNFRPEAASAKNAIGLMQLVPTTGGWEAHKAITGNPNAPAPSPQSLQDPVTSVQYGTTYLRQMYDRFSSVRDPAVRWHLAIAAYNAGPGTIDNALQGYHPDQFTLPDFWRWLNREAPAETVAYVPKVSHLWSGFRPMG